MSVFNGLNIDMIGGQISQITLSIPLLVWRTTAPIHQGPRRQKKQATPGWWAAVLSNETEEVCLGAEKSEETSTPTNKSQSFCRGLKWALVHMPSDGFFQILSLKAASFRHLLVWGWGGVGWVGVGRGCAGETHIPETWGRVRSPDCPRSR